MGLTDVMVLTIKPDDEEAAEVHQAEVTEVAGPIPPSRRHR